MANDRLYIYNQQTDEYVCIARHNGEEWKLGNVEILNQFLKEASGSATFSIGRESECSFKDKLHGKNFNLPNTWHYFE